MAWATGWQWLSSWDLEQSKMYETTTSSIGLNPKAGRYQ
jgi:hypothetical protein